MQLQLAQIEPVRFVRRHQSVREQPHVQDLCRHGRNCHPGDAPVEEHDENEVQDDIEHTSCDHIKERAHGVADRAKDIGFHIQDEDERHAREIDPQVQYGSGHCIFGRVQQPQHRRRSGKSEDHQRQADKGEHRQRVSDGCVNIILPAGAVDLCDHNCGPGGGRHEKTDQQIDDLGGASADRGKCDGTDKAADDQSVYSVIKLLDAGSGSDRKKEYEQTLPDNAGGQIFCG